VKKALTAGVLITACSALAACSSGGILQHASPPPRPAPAATLPAVPDSYIGFTGPGVPASYAPVTAFSEAIRHPVNLAMYYSGWFEGFQTAFAEHAWQHGATVFVNMDPPGRLGGIIAGANDGYLERFAASVKAFRHPVVISFGHEGNGDWYGYGYKHATPAQYIDAWRKVHDVITAAGASNVTWLWAVNIPVPHQTEPPADIWPGAAYVNWAGIDAYDWTGKETFGEEFGATVAALRKITPDPVLIAETSVIHGPGAVRQVKGLFAGIRADSLLGLVWFDTDKAGDKHINDDHDWRLQDDPPALSAFQSAVSPPSVVPSPSPVFSQTATPVPSASATSSVSGK
jgi:hypothetical protein